MENRIIKFRAWNIQQGKFLDIAAIDFYRLDSACVQIVGIEPHRYPITFPPDENILMQFTGLLDKNGKEIYEGDIVRSWIDFGPGGESLETFEVKFGSWGVSIQEWNYRENKIPEVIGNIYEHPELLAPVEKQ